MKILLQRVSSASVVVSGETCGAIERGLLLLVGFGKEDNLDTLRPMAEKLVNLRVFPNDQGKFHYSILDIKGELLLVPQFTLYADTRKGRRPEFFSALEPKAATQLFDALCLEFSNLGVSKVATGIFGADMKVSLLNDGPVTIMLDSSE